ncbi:MAG: hypothetical protein P1P76_04840 [Anaerolineales bacterium]|nr:hypothetical protein [Anaerolineales bacterium]
MTFKTLLLIKAVVCLTFGILLLFFPSFLLGILGASLTAPGIFLGREYGANMLGTLTLMWFAKDLGETKARQPILLYLFVYDAIGFIVTTINTLTGVLNGLGWGIVAVYLFITVSSAYLLLKSPRTAAAAG